ncbi:unnamed protein product, partial [Mesorhabditis belari]|uniref:Uncharacterized protein n=1 Tax=Mesorhabditis belari TaxID=2138241 RepID=A0AAF3J978_9BILA
MEEKAKPTYSIFRTAIIKATPDDLKCKFYCNGSTCKYCIPRTSSQDHQAIEALYSDWVAPNILAMARPLADHFQRFDLEHHFKRAGIRAVLNLEEPGEHAQCGPGLLPSGFTYEPEWFMKAGIYYYNFPLPDFAACSTTTIQDIVKVASFHLNEGKIAVHCHAGHGRTGMVIAAIFVYREGMRPSSAVRRVRKIRPQSVQSHPQVSLLNTMKPTLTNETLNKVVQPEYCGVEEAIEFQRNLLNPCEARKFAHIPKIVWTTCYELLSRYYETVNIRTKHYASTKSWAVDFELKDEHCIPGDDDLISPAFIIGLLDRKECKDFTKWLAKEEKSLNLENLDQKLKTLPIGQLLYLLDLHMREYKKLLTESDLIEVLRRNHSTKTMKILNANEFLFLFLLKTFGRILNNYRPELAFITCLWCTW